MPRSIAFLSAAAVLLGAATLAGGASAADYYDGDDRPPAYRGRDDLAIDGGGAWIERRDVRPAYRRAPGPVVFDEREPAPRFAGPRYGGPAWRRPGPDAPYGYGRPAAFVPPGERFYGGEEPGGGIRPAAVAVGPAFGAGDDGPDEGCTMERGRSITPAGWEKTVTRRTCYRR